MNSVWIVQKITIFFIKSITLNLPKICGHWILDNILDGIHMDAERRFFLLLFYLKKIIFIFSPLWNLQETFLLRHLLNLQLLTLQLLELLWSKQPYTHIWWPKMSVWSKIYNSEQNYFSSFEKASSWMLYFKKEEEGIDLFLHLVAPK